MKPFKIVLVCLLIAAMILSSGCTGKTAEDPESGQEGLSSEGTVSEPSDSSGSQQMEETSSEPEQIADVLTAVYLGADNASGKLRFFAGGEEKLFSDVTAETLPLLEEGEVYTITVLSSDSLLMIEKAAGEEPFQAASVSGNVFYWSIHVAPEGILLTQEEAPEDGTMVLLSEDSDRTDVFLPLPKVTTEPPLLGEAGVKTRKNLLMTAFAPVGACLYVPGGTAEDAGEGLPSTWADFFSWQDASYAYEDWENTPLAMIQHCGTDSGGYLAWVLETLLSSAAPLPTDATLFSTLEGLELGMTIQLPSLETDEEDEAYYSVPETISLLPGDLIMVGEEKWIVLGLCADGSIPVLRCAPALSTSGQLGGGVQLSAVGPSTDCLAYRLAVQVTESVYPQWAERYDTVLLDPMQLSSAFAFIWTDLADPEGLTLYSARKVVTDLFGTFPAPTEEEETASTSLVTVDPSWFDDALFIGDSITEHLRMYCQSTLALGNAQFLSSSSLSAVNALWPVSEQSVHPKIGDVKMRLEDAVAMKNPKYVYIMLGINSISFGIDLSLDDLELVVDLIKEKSPDVIFLMESVTPMTPNSDIMGDALNNYVIAEYNARLRERCEQNGWYFIDVAEVMTDEYGNLIHEYCSDPYAMGIHMTNAGAVAWIDYLLTHVPEDLT